ncbi:MAG: hypothetical protein ACRECO_12045 [Xanthobacteraceae bacterium]
MSKSKDTEDKAASPPVATETPVAVTAEAPLRETQIDLAFVEPPKTEIPVVASIAPKAAKPIEIPAVEMAKPADMPKSIEMPKAVNISKPIDKPVEMTKLADFPKPRDAQPTAPKPALAIGEDGIPRRSNRFALLAATVALCGAIGAMTGALAMSGIAWLGSSSTPAAASPMAAIDLSNLQDVIGTMRAEVAALKASVEANARTANTQFSKISSRIDHIDRAYAEPVAKLGKAVEALQRRNSASEVTGAVPTPAQRSAAAPPPPAIPSATPRTQIVDGWTLRGVNRGMAYIQNSRRRGVIEVARGDVVPGLGRIEAIQRKEGRWIVLTARGMIVAAR